MRKIIDLDDGVLTKIEILAAFENISVEHLLENAISFYVECKGNDFLKSLAEEEKEDLGLLLLMQQSERKNTVSREEILKNLD